MILNLKTFLAISNKITNNNNSNNKIKKIKINLIFFEFRKYSKIIKLLIFRKNQKSMTYFYIRYF